MESGSSCTRKKKHDAEEEDIFYRKLSEPQLISHILSFLPTRDAVRTSVLSKKWLNNWTFITKLDFNDSLYSYESNSFRRCTHCKACYYSAFYFSDKECYNDLVLCKKCSVSPQALYNGGNSLSFSDLRCVKAGDKDIGNRFVKFVYKTLLFTHHNSPISSMLERFSLVIYNKHNKHNVAHLNLEELELVLMMFTTIKVPTDSVQFRHLKHLKLSGINFVSDPSCDCLTLKLPLLKKFEIRNCSWSSVKDVIVEASLLESISIQQDLHKLQGQSIKFNALYLKEFSYCGYGLSQQIYQSGCGFVSYASVKIILKRCENNIPEKTWSTFQLFQHFHQVKCIKLEGSEVLTQSDDIYPISALPALPELANLSHLELGLVNMEVILGLLQKSPVLKTQALKEIPQFAKELLNSSIIPDCLTSADCELGKS